MALTPNFTAESVVGTPENILFTDTSGGSDGTITSRRIYVQMDNGDFVVEAGSDLEYSEWDYADSTIELDLLTEDIAAKVTVQWLNVSNVVVTDKTLYYGFTEFNEEFLYSQTQLMAGNPLLINDNNFWTNYSKMRTLIDAGNNAITYASDLYNAQLCYDTATGIRNESQYTFNGNS